MPERAAVKGWRGWCQGQPPDAEGEIGGWSQFACERQPKGTIPNAEAKGGKAEGALGEEIRQIPDT
eukprot:1873598-Prorocentrum_lima.AAC.1